MAGQFRSNSVRHRETGWSSLGYAGLAASTGLVGVTFDHRLYTIEHYPDSADDLSQVVQEVRKQPQFDPARIALWFFSGSGGLAADWLRAAPNWLRGIAWTYPVLVPPPDWPGDGPRFDCSRTISESQSCRSSLFV